ncbi:hypothetical protein EBU71_09295 [bacterium]|nr:hypothetical protein [Candidatus Elulimicrobium humile]
MANTNLKLVGLDFDNLKNNFKEYLKRSDSPFKDADFEGSNISHLLDILAYNTYINSFYLNMVASEMFLDSATLRDSIVSHAKELNYIPRSFRSAEAKVSFSIYPSSALDALVIPKATSFTTKIGSNNFTFSTDSSIVLIANSSGYFNANNLTIYEGTYISDTFVYSTANTEQRFVISNPTVDTRSISVVVLENNGANVYSYTRATSFLDQEANSQIYFLQAAENQQYEIIFGDDIIGRKPQNGAVITVEYRNSSGELPNGAAVFTIDGPINGQSNISTISTNQSARGGGVPESLESIKYNAPRHYQNQDRAVTSIDYENILLANFPEIQAVSAFGGEDADPPQYGKVFISVDVNTGEGASDLDKRRFLTFIERRNPIGITPEFIDPEFLYVEVVSTLTYNTNVTTLSIATLETLVRGVISSFNTTYLNKFNTTLRYSKLLEEIDNTHNSILGAYLKLIPYKTFIPTINTLYSVTINFGFPLSKEYIISDDESLSSTIPAIRSTAMTRSGLSVFLMDDANGKVGLYTAGTDGTLTLVENVGTVDYSTGKVVITNLLVDSYTPASGASAHLFATPASSDITSSKNTILLIRDSDVEVIATAVKE